MITSTRPSGASILTNVVVKVFPDTTEATLAYSRQRDNSTVAVKPLLLRGNAVVMELGQKPEQNEVSLRDLQPLLEVLWATKTTSFRPTTVNAYLDYVFRDEYLPNQFKYQVGGRVNDIGEPNAEQIHGDLTSANVVKVYGSGFRLIDFSVRKELPYREADTAKFKFHEYRMLPSDVANVDLTPAERFFFACHFCRVWTRDVEARPELERIFNEYFTRL